MRGNHGSTEALRADPDHEDALRAVEGQGLIAMMLVVLAIGIIVDIMLFGRMEKLVRRRWGLIETSS